MDNPVQYKVFFDLENESVNMHLPPRKVYVSSANVGMARGTDKMDRFLDVNRVK